MDSSDDDAPLEIPLSSTKKAALEEANLEHQKQLSLKEKRRKLDTRNVTQKLAKKARKLNVEELEEAERELGERKVEFKGEKKRFKGRVKVEEVKDDFRASRMKLRPRTNALKNFKKSVFIK